MKLFVATHNAHKLREISQILPTFEIVPDDPVGVVEDAPDFAGNALEVAALGGAPGVKSARYAGEPSDTAANNALLLKNLAGVADRRANFTCAIALVAPDGTEHVVTGRCYGSIAAAPSGFAGFGYDPLFHPDRCDCSFAELSEAEKNAISHRGVALAEAKKIIGG